MKDYLSIDSNTVLLSAKSELKPDDAECEKSNEQEKSDFQTEQIDSPLTSKNLENLDRESEEWEGISNKIFQGLKNHSPDTVNSKKQNNGDSKFSFEH